MDCHDFFLQLFITFVHMHILLDPSFPTEYPYRPALRRGHVPQCSSSLCSASSKVQFEEHKKCASSGNVLPSRRSKSPPPRTLPSSHSTDRFEFEAAQLAQCKYEEIYDCYLLINIIYGFLSSPGAPACVGECASNRVVDLRERTALKVDDFCAVSSQLRDIFNSIPFRGHA